MSFAVYLDEDSGRRKFNGALLQRGVDVVRASDVGMRGRSDPEQLQKATELRRALIKANRGHFSALQWQWMQESREHAGIVIVVQDQANIGADWSLA